MPIIEQRTFKDGLSNVDFMNYVRQYASSEYQNRIEVVTKENIQAQAAALLDYEPNRNEFIDVFINKIGLTIGRTMSFQNPWKEFKIGQLQRGDTIEEWMVGLIKSKTYNADRLHLEKDIFGKYPNEVQVNYHQVNRQEYYPLTVNTDLLERAFLTPDGLLSLVSQLMASLMNSAEYDEFLAMAHLLKEYVDLTGGGYTVHVDDVGDIDSTAPQARYLIRRIKEISSMLAIPSRRYNVAGMPTNIKPEDMMIILTPEADAAMDVEALAAAFQVDKLTLPQRKVVVSNEYLEIPGFVAALVPKWFLVVADKLFKTTNADNPIDLHRNYFLHIHQVLSFSRFAPVVIFWTGPGTEITRLDTPVVDVADITFTNRQGNNVTTLPRGEMYQVNSVAVTAPAGGANNGARLVLSGNESSMTYLSPTGMLHVALNETAQNLTVKAIATDDQAFAETATVPLSGQIISIWPVVQFADDGDILVSPVKPGQTGNVIHVPDVQGVVYKIGAATITDDYTITKNETVTASALPGYELVEGAAVSWPFVFTA